MYNWEDLTCTLKWGQAAFIQPCIFLHNNNVTFAHPLFESPVRQRFCCAPRTIKGPAYPFVHRGRCASYSGNLCRDLERQCP